MASPEHRVVLRAGRPLLILGILVTAWILLLPEGRAFVHLTTSSGIPLFWPTAQAALNLRLGCPPSPLPNWGPCWDDAATDAAARWNSAGSRFRFSVQSPAVSADSCMHSDRINTAAFQTTLCGMAFGDTLAATVSAANAATGALVDTDVLFDAGRQWSTYPGPLQRDALGAVIAYDFHRVAIHEFGHVLGLDHPDAHGQSVVAIMNARTSDIDDLQPDDIAGVNAIYPSGASPPTGALENPSSGSFQSGIGIVSGWVCNANRVDIVFDGTATFQAAYGTSREDTRPVCGKANTGFGLLINWNLLGNGTHTVRASADGADFGSATFTITTLGTEFLRGASGRFRAQDFPNPGTCVILRWQESLQNFVIDSSGPSACTAQ